MRDDFHIDEALGGQKEVTSVNGTKPPENKEEKPPRKSQTTKLLEMSEAAELFHFGDECLAAVPVGNHFENWPIFSKGFRRWLTFRYFEHEGRAPSARALQEALETLSGKAQFKGSEQAVYARVGGTDQEIFLDLGNDSWEAVQVIGSSWRTFPLPPLKFKRPRGLSALPTPLPGGSIEDLRPFVNIELADWPLLIGWLVAALRPLGPFPVLVLHGEQGSAKSTLTRVLKSLLDPNTAPLRPEPRDARDLVISASNSWVLALDNLSHLPVWLSDSLCRLSTGGGFSTRELYTNDEEKLFEARRPIILNGIEELATRGDLLDRSIILYMPTITEERRMPEDVFWREFERKRPLILGALLDGVSTAIRNLPDVTLEKLPRMADFAKWVTAAAPAFGWEREAFLDVYLSNREEINELTLDASPLTEPLLRVLSSGTWVGTSTELLARLNALWVGSSRAWPSNPIKLSGALRRLSPNLRRIGVHVEFGRINKRRFIKLEKAPEVSSQSSLTSQTPTPHSDLIFGDDSDERNPVNSTQT